jgi:hypothetical protein
MEDAHSPSGFAVSGPFDDPAGAGAHGGGTSASGPVNPTANPAGPGGASPAGVPMSIVGLSSPAGVHDPFSDLAFFTRKDVMGMAFNAGILFYQQLAIDDHKIKAITTAPENSDLCLEHVVYNLAKYLNDTRMGLAFAAAESKMNLTENPWVLAIERERIMIAMMASAGPGP